MLASFHYTKNGKIPDSTKHLLRNRSHVGSLVTLYVFSKRGICASLIPTNSYPEAFF